MYDWGEWGGENYNLCEVRSSITGKWKKGFIGGL